LRRVLRTLDPKALERAFSSWVASLKAKGSGVAAIDGKTLRGKTLRGTKPDQERGGRLACRLGLCARGWSRALAARAVESKGNEITAIPELLARLALEGAVVTIDAIGTQEAIARTIIAKKADYLLALKENQGSLYADVADFFADPALASACGEWRRIEAGHGRIEDRLARAADAAWLAERHPRWAGLRSIAAISATRTDKKTGAASTQTRLYISSLPPDPALLLAACRSHWSVENNLPWRLDVTFREDQCRIRKDYAAINLARMRHAALAILTREPTKIPIKRKRLKAAINPQFRTTLLAC